MLRNMPWLAPIIVFGLVVFVHELGHFVAAKVFGVYAPRFSIGFGPALWRKRWGETEYVLAALPLGGYVRMASREDETAASLEGGNEESSRRREGDKGYDPDALMPFGPHPVPANRQFESQPLWQRLVIMVAGVTMNIVLALLAFTFIMKWEGRTIIETRAVAEVGPLPWAPQLAREITLGDTIVAVGGRPVTTWNDVRTAITESPDTALTIRTQRATVTVPASGPRSARRRQLNEALAPLFPPVIGSVTNSAPAGRAGIQRGDTIVSIDGKPIADWTSIPALISPAAGREIAVTVARGGERRTVRMKPDSVGERNAESGTIVYRGVIGVLPRTPSRRESVSLGEAATGGWRATWGSTAMVIGVVRDLMLGRVSLKQLGGPIAITRASVDAARDGLTSFLSLLAFISVNLAVMNLLPIPILDGGQIVMNLAEAVKGRPFSLRTREYMARAGLLLLLLLFVVVTFNDLRRLLGTAWNNLTGAL